MASPDLTELRSPGLAIVIMGVSGSGKSTVGNALAKSLNCVFLEADDFHSIGNKEKMSNGVPLSDEDRIPWLEALRDATLNHISYGKRVVLTCSALQRKYREILRNADAHYKLGNYKDCRVRFACLQAPVNIIEERIKRRSKDGKHFMPVSLLKSQLDLLQICDDEEIVKVDATLSLQSVVSIIQVNMNIEVSHEESTNT